MRFGRRVDADVRIYVQEVRAVHTNASDGGMRAAVRLPGMRRACPPSHPDRARLSHHVGRRAAGRRKVRAHHRWIARPGKIARSRMQLLRRSGFQDGETCQGESVSASLTDLASRDPANLPQADPIFSLKSVAPIAARLRRAMHRPARRRGCSALTRRSNERSVSGGCVAPTLATRRLGKCRSWVK